MQNIVRQQKTASGRRDCGGIVYFGLATILLLWMAYDAFGLRLITYGATSDIWEHITVLQEWSRNLSKPLHPHTGSEVGSPRFTPLFGLYALVIAVSGVNAFDMISYISVFHILLFVLGIWWIGSSVFKNAWSASILLLVALFFWGTGWGWANAYDLRALTLVISYPSLGIFGLSLILIGWSYQRLNQREEMSYVAHLPYMLLISIIFISHPLTAIFTFTALFVMWLLALREENGNWKWLGGLFVCAIILSFFWPYFSLFDVLFRDRIALMPDIEKQFDPNVVRERLSSLSTLGREKYFYNLDQLLKRSGPALYTVVCTVPLLFIRRYRWIALLGGGMGAVVVANMFVKIPLGHRFIFFFLFCGHLSFVCCLMLSWEYLKKQSGSKIVLKATLAVFILCLGYVSISHIQYTVKWAEKRRNADIFDIGKVSPVVSRYEQLASALPDDAVVLSDLKTSFGLPAFTGKVIAPLRGTFFLKDNNERRMATMALLGIGVWDETRLKYLHKYHVTHLVIQPVDMNNEIERFVKKYTREIPVPTTDRVFEILG